MQPNLKYALCAFAFFTGALDAKPEIASTAKGCIHFNDESKAILMTATDNAIIDWQNFSIDKDESLHIALPSQESTVIFRVTAHNTSQIDGKLTSNGSIELVNESGITIKGAIACEGDLKLNGQNIVNRARIEGRNVFLMSTSTDEEIISIDNKGLIRAAPQGRIEMIAASGKVLQRNLLLAESGCVVLTGDVVLLKDGSLIDVSGPKMGGQAYIGGGWQGQDATIANAKATLVHPEARIIADSKESGNGGTVVIWGDMINKFLGSISAEGAGFSGRGGDVEVSAKGQLSFDGKVNVSAPFGACGTVLLDPTSITINLNPPANINGTPGTDITSANEVASSATYPGINSIITAGALNNLLTGTPATATLSAVSFITVNAPITATGPSPVNLVLNAPTINLNAPITLPFGGTLDGSAFVVNVGPTGTIQNGVDIVSSNDVVNLSAGTYQQQVNIQTPLTLNGAGINDTTILAPAALTNSFATATTTVFPVVMANGVTGGFVNIQNLTVDGNNGATGGATARYCAIGYNNTNGAIINVHTLNTATQFPPGPTGNGTGILYNYTSGRVNEFHVVDCVVERFERTGIQVGGRGVPGQIGQLGINILRNTVIGVGASASATTFAAVGILLTNTGGGGGAQLPKISPTVAYNNVTGLISAQANSSIAINLILMSNSIVHANTCTQNSEGIEIDSCTNSVVSYNDASNNLSGTSLDAGSGIIVDAEFGNNLNIYSNAVANNGTVGITVREEFPPNVNYLFNNSVSNNPTGVVISGSDSALTFFSNNTITAGATGAVGVHIAGDPGIGPTGPLVNFNEDVFVGPFSTTLIENVDNTNPYTGSFTVLP